jgi:hypothetical protein
LLPYLLTCCHLDSSSNGNGTCDCASTKWSPKLWSLGWQTYLLISFSIHSLCIHSIILLLVCELPHHGPLQIAESQLQLLRRIFWFWLGFKGVWFWLSFLLFWWNLWLQLLRRISGSGLGFKGFWFWLLFLLLWWNLSGWGWDQCRGQLLEKWLANNRRLSECSCAWTQNLVDMFFLWTSSVFYRFEVFVF